MEYSGTANVTLMIGGKWGKTTKVILTIGKKWGKTANVPLTIGKKTSHFSNLAAELWQMLKPNSHIGYKMCSMFTQHNLSHFTQ